METLSWYVLTSCSSLVAIVVKGLIIWGSKCHKNNSPEVCDDHVTNEEEAEVDSVTPQPSPSLSEELGVFRVLSDALSLQYNAVMIEAIVKKIAIFIYSFCRPWCSEHIVDLVNYIKIIYMCDATFYLRRHKLRKFIKRQCTWRTGAFWMTDTNWWMVWQEYERGRPRPARVGLAYQACRPT